MSNPLISIIINNYNYGRFLKQAINSAINQTYPNVEVIVVDDGSTDESRQIIGSFGDKVIPVLKENGGQASAFNAGFKKSKGEVIIFLDSDDTLFPEAMSNAVVAFDTSVVIKVHWQMWRINETGERTGGVVPQCPLTEGNLLKNLVMYGPDHCGGPPYSPPTSGNAWSRQFLEQVLPMPLQYNACADLYLFVLAPVFGELRRLTEPQGCYRIHGSNITLQPPEKFLKDYFGWFEQSCLALSQNLRKKGIEVDPTMWTRDSWYHKLHQDIQNILNIVPPGARFILVDDNKLGTKDTMEGRRRSHMVEVEGEYWGPPEDDKAAIAEVERQRKEGAAFIVFSEVVFWWLDHYKGFFNYLKANYKCVFQNKTLIIYNL